MRPGHGDKYGAGHSGREQRMNGLCYLNSGYLRRGYLNSGNQLSEPGSSRALQGEGPAV